ncbi:HTH-type transcriptional regulator SinR [compost metagenome]
MTHSLSRIFAGQVARIRKERGLTQEELALIAGLDRTYISGIERCRRNVTIKTVESVAKALQVQAHVLFIEDVEHE